MSQISQPSSPSVRAPISWLLKRHGRLLICLLAAALGFLVTWRLDLETRLIIAFDLGAIVYLGLFVTLMNEATPQQAAELSSRTEPSGTLMLVGVIVMSVVSIAAVGAMHQPGPDAPKIVYLVSSLAAICLAWLLVHIRFGLFYMTMYYDDTVPDDMAVYDEGMEMPGRKTPDYWDFMYYSFMIAMCYQTSDVTITAAKMRRVTLLHAIFSFLYVVAIIGLVVNILGNVI